MRRREVIKGLAGSAVAWPLTVHAQSQSKVLRVGAVFPAPRSRPQWQALEHRLSDLGYRDGANYIMDYVKIPRVAEADYKTELSETNGAPRGHHCVWWPRNLT